MSRRLSLWGLLIVVPLALWVAIGDNWMEYRRKNREDIVEAPPHTPFSFEGSVWLFEKIQIVPPDHAGALPPNTMRVALRISVTPQDATVAERLRMCEVWLMSESGKRWSPGSRFADRAPDSLPASCHGTFREHPEAGKTFRFEQTFVVPTAAVDDVEPLIVLPKQKPDGQRAPLLLLRRG